MRQTLTQASCLIICVTWANTETKTTSPKYKAPLYLDSSINGEFVSLWVFYIYLCRPKYKRKKINILKIMYNVQIEIYLDVPFKRYLTEIIF